MPVKARAAALAYYCALSLILLGAVLPLAAAAQETGMSGGPPAAGAFPVPAAERDLAARSARSIECAQRADAQGLQGKMRKHFLHECRSGV